MTQYNLANRSNYYYYQSQLVLVLARYDYGWLVEFVRGDRAKIIVQPSQLNQTELPISIPIVFEDVLAALRGILLKLQYDPLSEQYNFDDLLARLDYLSYLLGTTGSTAEWGLIIGDIQNQIDLIEQIVQSSQSASWGSITGTLSDQSDLNTALGNKSNVGHSHTVAWGSITGTLSTQTDLNSALSGKSNVGHTHTAGDITGLSTAWGSITGTLSSQTDLNSALSAKAPLASPSFTGTVQSAGDLYAQSIYEKHSSLGSISGAVNLNLANYSSYDATIAGNTTFTFSNPAASGNMNTLYMELVNPGAFTITWPASVKWPGGTEPTWTASGTDIAMFVSRDGGTTWHGVLSTQDSQ